MAGHTFCMLENSRLFNISVGIQTRFVIAIYLVYLCIYSSWQEDGITVRKYCVLDINNENVPDCSFTYSD
jgi:uncharacterized membrane protein